MNKIRCTKAQQSIVRGLDEGLDGVSQEELDRHLAECPACRQFRSDTAEVLHTVRHRSVEDPEDAFWQHYQVSLDAKLRSREPRSRGLWTWSNAAFAAGFALIVLSIGLGAMGLMGDPPTLNNGHLAAIGEIDRLFGIGSDEWILYESRLPVLVAGFDTTHATYDVSIASLTDPGQDSFLGLDEESGSLQ